MSWYLHVWNEVAMARNPPTYPAVKRSLDENLVNERRIWCSAQVRLLVDRKGDSISLFEIRLGSAGEPTICSHCYSVPYMKKTANNQVMLLLENLKKCLFLLFIFDLRIAQMCKKIVSILVNLFRNNKPPPQQKIPSDIYSVFLQVFNKATTVSFWAFLR